MPSGERADANTKGFLFPAKEEAVFLADNQLGVGHLKWYRQYRL